MPLTVEWRLLFSTARCNASSVSRVAPDRTDSARNVLMLASFPIVRTCLVGHLFVMIPVAMASVEGSVYRNA